MKNSFSNRKKIIIYTDGSCNVKDPLKRGGFGVYALYSNKEYCLRRGYWNTTTARMEMFALLEAIKMVNPKIWTNVMVYSDSQFVVKSFKEGYINKWRMAQWIGVKNSDIWKEIVKEIDVRGKMVFGISWLHGHQKDLANEHIFGNNCADALADYKTQDSYTQDKPLEGFSWIMNRNTKEIFIDTTENFGKMNVYNSHRLLGDCYYNTIEELKERIFPTRIYLGDCVINTKIEKI